MFRPLSAYVLVTLAYAGPNVRNKLRHFDGRIVGGNEIDISEAPYQLSLQYYGFHICGASILNSRFAITAAHCTNGRSLSAMTIRAGSTQSSSGGQVVNVDSILQHPKYDARSTDYDVSVLRLASSLTMGSPIEIATTEPAVGADATVTGWGLTMEDGSSSENLMSVTVPIVSRTDCEEAYKDENITERMICAGFLEGGKDSCQGDSGGPLVSGGKLVGVVSWGYGCAHANYPGVYANVANLAEYISSQVIL